MYEVDEMFRFVGNKKNKQWVWIAMDTKSRQIIAFLLYSVVKEQISNLLIIFSLGKRSTYLTHTRGMMLANKWRVLTCC